MDRRTSSIEQIERVALRAARVAGAIHMRWLKRTSVGRKSNALDLVTEADREAEAAALGIITRTFPSHTVVAEESCPDGAPSDHRWIIDPLDGTTNFAHGYPQFCVSIAYQQRGRVELGVIFDPLKKELFTARQGKGARLNGRPIKVSAISKLEYALLGTGFPYDRRQRRRLYLSFWEAFMMRVQGVRRTGSAALDLAWVACGRVDGFWEFGLKSWDVAAGSLVVEEAGGKVTNMDGSPLNLDGGRILASNTLVHEEMRQVIADAYPEAERRQAELG
jgi:myo-inositol-1(or 4)-monophosphatase